MNPISEPYPNLALELGVIREIVCAQQYKVNFLKGANLGSACEVS